MAMVRFLACAAVAALLVLQCIYAWAEQRISDAELAAELRSGAMVILMTHAATNHDQADTQPLNYRRIFAQRQLSEQGRQSAAGVGVALKVIGARLTEAYTSRYYRAIETARLAGIVNIKPTLDLTEGGHVVSPNENKRRAAALRDLLAQPVLRGQNRFIITHRCNIIEAFGKEWFDVKEGEVLIFKSEAGTYTFLARLAFDELTRIAATARN
jgi:hypothetical protein